MRFMSIAMSATICLLSGAAQAQVLTELKAGDRVRVTAPGIGRIEATLEGLHGDSIALRGPGAAGRTWSIQYGQVQRFDVFRPKAGSHAAAGALGGLVAGAVFFGTVAYFETRCSECEGVPDVVALVAIPGGILGAAVGGLAGWTQRKDGWKRLPLPLHISAARIEGKAGLIGRLAF